MAKEDNTQLAKSPAKEEPVVKGEQLKPRTRKQARTPVVYVGPTLTDPHIACMAIFRGDLPERVKSLTKEDKDLARLFVSVADLAKARTNLKKPGHPLYEATGAVAGRYRRRAAA